MTACEVVMGVVAAIIEGVEITERDKGRLSLGM
jgi:hypothetical protein